MRTIIHISDIHFGKIDVASTPSLVGAFSNFNPDLVIISGDLTQRAGTSEFKNAPTRLGVLATSILTKMNIGYVNNRSH